MWATALAVAVGAIVGVAGSEPHRIAVVGGGVGGAAFAAIARQLLEEAKVPTHITVFERGDRLGGRVNSIDINGLVVEAGGSVYHRENALVRSFVTALNLTEGRPLNAGTAGVFRHYAAESVPQGGRGGEFVFRESEWSVVSAICALWRYGLSPLKARSTVRKMLDTFHGLYHRLPAEPVESALGVLQSIGLGELPGSTGGRHLAGAGVGPRFIDELATGITRANYGSPVTLNAFAGMVSLAGSGADLFAAVDGNQRIAEGAVHLAGAVVKLAADVRAVALAPDDGGYVVTVRRSDPCATEQRWWRDGSHPSSEQACPAAAAPGEHATRQNDTTFDTVVIASPLAAAGIELHGELAGGAAATARARSPEYRTTHATFVRARFSEAYFGVPSSEMPQTIITTEPPDVTAEGVGSAVHFSSIGTLQRYKDGSRLLKVFSRFALTDEHLRRFLAWPSEAERVSALASTVRRAWKAYPYLWPSAAPIDIDLPFVLHAGESAQKGRLLFLNAMEAYVSTMETQMLAGCNAAHLLARSLLPHKPLGAANCTEVVRALAKRRGEGAT